MRLDNLVQAEQGDFIRDNGPQKRSMGFVVKVDQKTSMMQVIFPKINKTAWVPLKNYGQYTVI